MPQKVIRKVNLNISSLITNTVGSNGELLQNAGSSTVNFNLANHIVENNLNGNNNSPSPNTIKSLFDSANNTQVRIVGHPDDGGVQLGATVGSAGDVDGDGSPDNDVEETGRRGFFIFDLGRKINPRKFQLILDNSTRFIQDDECLNSNNPPPKGVRLRFSNDLTLLDHQGAVDANGKDLDESTSYKDNSDFTIVSVAAGVAPHTEISTSGVISTVGDTSSFNQKVLTFDKDFFTTGVNNAFDGYRFFIVEFRGSRFAYTFDIFDLSLFEEVDPIDYSVEFDDSVLDLAGWKNPRYDGSKLTGQKINEFNRGDISYGKNPVVENKTNALYIVDTCIGAENEDAQFAFITGHSYLTIKQILLINEGDDEVQLISRDSEDFNSFQRFITSNLKTNNSFSARIIDSSIQDNLKRKYFIKFNKGFLLKSFTFEEPFFGDVLDQNGSLIEFKTQTNRPSLILTDKFEEVDAQFGGTFEENLENRMIFSYGSPYFSYDAGEELDANGGGLDGFFRLYGPSYHDSNVNIFQNKFTEQYYGPTADFNNIFDDPTLDNASGDDFINHFMTGSFGKLTGNVYTGTSNANDGGFDFEGTGKLGNNAFVKAVDFISHKTFNFLKKHNSRIDIPEEEKTELFVTFFKGKEINNANTADVKDERSINTFEVEPTSADQLRVGSNIPDAVNAFTTLPLIMFKAEAPDLRFRYNNFSPDTFGNNNSMLFQTRIVNVTFETTVNFNERINSNDGLGPTITIGSGEEETSFKPTRNSSEFNLPGDFEYEISFLDKGPTIIADINKDNELFDGIGEKGLLIIPDQIESQIKQNIDFYLRKAGIIERKTIKAPPRPER